MIYNIIINLTYIIYVAAIAAICVCVKLYLKVHLKAILRDVCNYNLKNPHKNTYELKPEYRHYKKEEGEDTESALES